MEWRAGFGTVSTQHISLIQLALKERVFLLDLCAPGVRHHSLTVSFIRELLTEPSVLKLGEETHSSLRRRVRRFFSLWAFMRTFLTLFTGTCRLNPLIVTSEVL